MDIGLLGLDFFPKIVPSCFKLKENRENFFAHQGLGILVYFPGSYLLVAVRDRHKVLSSALAQIKEV